jgi:hypothetical protein
VIARVRQYFEWMHRDLEAYKTSLAPFARAAVVRRRTALGVAASVAADLGLPIRRRDGRPETYRLPDIRRSPKFEKPEAKIVHKAEPALEMAEFDNILSVMDNMTRVIEMSPASFAAMSEEDLRNHFLVQLNGQYEGRATGETFNFTGKTDIVIKEDGRNVFVAECKFWDGEASATRAVDQILGYLGWRDTKAALLIFNRRKGFSAVLGKLWRAVGSHSQCEIELGTSSETSRRYRLQRQDDKERKVILAVTAYEVPGS